jgi:hypothetical protein
VVSNALLLRRWRPPQVAKDARDAPVAPAIPSVASKEAA